MPWNRHSKGFWRDGFILRSPQSNHINCERVPDKLLLCPAKTITHNIPLIMGYSWLFGIGSLCCFGPGIYCMFYRLEGGKEEAFALYGAAFTRCSFHTAFLLLAILNPINPEPARERLRDGSRK